MKTYLTIDVGGTYTKSALMDENGRMLQRYEKIFTAKESEQAFLTMLRRLIRTVQQETRFDGVALSAPGMIDSANGIMRTGGSIFVIDHLPVVELLSAETGVMVSVENDARCAALAEVWQGALHGCRSGVVMILGTAVGGAILVDGKLLHGAHGMAGEFSYVMTQAEACMQRQYLLAEQGGVPALIALASERLGSPADTLTGEAIFQRAEAGEIAALDALRAYASRLAVQMLNLQVVLDPEKIAVGGGVSERPLLLHLIDEELRRIAQVYPHPLPLPQVEACCFRNDANLLGALYHHIMQAKEREE